MFTIQHPHYAQVPASSGLQCCIMCYSCLLSHMLAKSTLSLITLCRFMGVGSGEQEGAWPPWIFKHGIFRSFFAIIQSFFRWPSSGKDLIVLQYFAVFFAIFRSSFAIFQSFCYFSVFFPLALPWKRLNSATVFCGLFCYFSVFFCYFSVFFSVAPLPLGNFSADALVQIITGCQRQRCESRSGRDGSGSIFVKAGANSEIWLFEEPEGEAFFKT